MEGRALGAQPLLPGRPNRAAWEGASLPARLGRWETDTAGEAWVTQPQLFLLPPTVFSCPPSGGKGPGDTVGHLPPTPSHRGSQPSATALLPPSDWPRP